ncbi:MAG TPA: (2Fe-2S)-binding protein [Bryobacteraceae bacterium]|nr:(2Fe-2S)-binding protein [Bryobacteraceae bacterium]
MPDSVRVRLNGESIRVPAGVSVAACVFLSGKTALRTSVTGEPRSALCGMGVCFECRVTINGSANRRSCLVNVREGMVIETA